MKIDWKNSSKSPYDMVIDIIESWCTEKGYYSDMVVSLKLDGIIYNAYLELNTDISGWTWEWDWFEGEEVELLGFCPVNEVIIPEKYMLRG